MTMLTDVIARVRQRIAATSRRARFATAALIAMLLTGAIWLAVAAPPSRWVAAGEAPLAPDHLAAVTRTLSERGTPYRTEHRRLYVRPEALAAARQLIADEQDGPAGQANSLEAVATAESIWNTEGQRVRQWQAAKMSALAREIRRFPSVRSAVVMLASGTPRRLSRPAIPPTAAVNVVLAEGKRMRPALAAKIAALVSGSIAELKCQDVRVIDSAGASIRVDESGRPVGAGPEALRRLAEAETAERIHSRLAHIDGLIVCVRLSAAQGPQRRGTAAVSVPRTYLAAVCRSMHAGDDESGIRSAAAELLPEVRRTAARAAGLPEADVSVAWHHDVAAAPDTPAAASTAVPGWMWGLVSLSLLTAAGLGMALAWRRRRPGGPPAAPAHDQRPAAQAAPSEDTTTGEGLFELLQSIPCDELSGIIGQEHPQTLAVMLSGMDETRAAAVLGGLAEPLQADVAQRVAQISEIDVEVKAELERGLAARLAAARRSPSPGGTEKVAAILRHAGYVTEKAVLGRLDAEAPQLAAAVRDEMFSFEDLLSTPPDRLGPKLSRLGGQSLAVAIRTADKELKAKVMACLPPEAAKRLRRQMREIGAVRLSDVEAARRRVIEALRYESDGPAGVTEGSLAELSG